MLIDEKEVDLITEKSLLFLGIKEDFVCKIELIDYQKKYNN